MQPIPPYKGDTYEQVIVVTAFPRPNAGEKQQFQTQSVRHVPALVSSSEQPNHPTLVPELHQKLACPIHWSMIRTLGGFGSSVDSVVAGRLCESISAACTRAAQSPAQAYFLLMHCVT